MENYKVCRKMHLLDRKDFSKSMDTLPQVVNDIYGNFTSMAHVIKGLTENSPYRCSIYELVQTLIGFIRLALKWCFDEDGVVNTGFVSILADIESYFMKLPQLLDALRPDPYMYNLSLLWSNPNFQSLVFCIQNADLTFWRNHDSFVPIFSEESVMERLDQAMKDESMYEAYGKQCVFLKMFIQQHADCSENIYLWAERALDMMSLYFIIYKYQRQSLPTTNRIAASIHTLVLQGLVRGSGSTPPFNDELLVAYVECFQKFVIWIPKKPNYQIKIIQDMLSLVHSLISDTHKHEIDMEKLLESKTLVHNALKKLGCIIPSFLSSESDGDEGSFVITDRLTGIFKALILPLDSEGFLSDETLTKYACYFRHYLFQLPTNGNQYKFDEDLVFVAHVIYYKWSEYLVGQELLFNARVEMLGVLRELGSIIYSSLNNEVKPPIGIHPRVLVKFERIRKRIKLKLRRTIFPAVFKRFSLHTPDTDLLGFLDFLIENFKELGVLQTIPKDLVRFRSFIQNARDNSIKDHRLQAISILIRNAAYDAEFIANAFAAGSFHVSCKSFIISDLIEQFNLIKEQVNDEEIIVKGLCDASRRVLDPTTNSNKDGIPMSSRASSPSTDVFVGLETEKMRLMKFLASDEKQLDVISVVGMGGIGKTTLAKKVYEECFTVNHFHRRAWCRVSQEYDMKDVLLSILGRDVNRQKQSCQELSLILHKELKWCKYLIVLDDIWDIDVLDDLKRFFPNDANGSRIVLTSRTISIGSHSKYHSETIELHPLSNDESWNILKQKVFPKEECPIELVEIGNEIARKCGGLPLAVVVTAGILSKSQKEQDVWDGVAERLNIYTADDIQGEMGMKALDLSYELLPDHLKPFFLYVGAFPEYYHIPANKLKWLWIADGFIRQETDKNKSLEDQAETHLMDLIDRSLLMVGMRNSSGSVKTCSIHDLMREMSLTKAKMENFMQHHHIRKIEHLREQQLIYPRRVSVSFIDGKAESTPSSSIAYESPPRPPMTHEDLFRLSMSSRLNSFLLFRRPGASKFEELCKPTFQIHKMLRVIHTDNVGVKNFFMGVTLPVHLRYISVNSIYEIPLQVFSISWYLETLIIKSYSVVEVPVELWKLAKLRHLHIGHVVLREPDEDSCKLENLQTLSTPYFIGEATKMIERFPNLLHLKCNFSDNKGNINLPNWPRLESLYQLESARVWWYGDVPCSSQLSFPSTLKKLTLSYFGLEWEDVASFQELPNLEVLKLQDNAVEDELWDMGDIQFPKLKFLKLRSLDLKQWIASDENFPSLQNLLLHNCNDLEEIPSGLGDICSLENIEVLWCSNSASDSAKLIQQEQAEYGNNELKVVVALPWPESGEVEWMFQVFVDKKKMKESKDFLPKFRKYK